MLVLGVVTMLVGALSAMTETDLKRLLAFSTVSQVGHIMTALGLATPLGVAAGLFYTVSHGLFKATLFLCAGAVQHAAGTKDLRRLGGLAPLMPWTSRVWLVAAAAIVGVPLGNGFVAKWLLLGAALDAGQVIVVLATWLVSVFTAFYIVRATVSVFYGELPDPLRARRIEEAPAAMLAGMGVLAALCIVFGVAPQLLMTWVVGPAVRSLGLAWTVEVSWLGVQTTSAGIQVTAGAGIVVVAVVAGLALYRFVARPKLAPVGVFTGGDPLASADASLGAADFVEVGGGAFEPVNRALDPDRFYLAAWRLLARAAGALDCVATPIAERHALATAVAVAVVVFVVVWLL